MDPNNDKTLDLDLDALTVQALEVLQLELQEFLNTKLYATFQQSCRTLKHSLVDAALKSELRGVESLFVREQLFGESTGWSNMESFFDDLSEEIAKTLKTKQ